MRCLVTNSLKLGRIGCWAGLRHCVFRATPFFASTILACVRVPAWRTSFVACTALVNIRYALLRCDCLGTWPKAGSRTSQQDYSALPQLLPRVPNPVPSWHAWHKFLCGSLLEQVTGCRMHCSGQATGSSRTLSAVTAAQPVIRRGSRRQQNLPQGRQSVSYTLHSSGSNENPGPSDGACVSSGPGASRTAVVLLVMSCGCHSDAF